MIRHPQFARKGKRTDNPIDEPAQPDPQTEESESRDCPAGAGPERAPIAGVLRLYKCQQTTNAAVGFRIILRQSVFEDIVEYLGSNVSFEQGGLLCGREVDFGGNYPPVVIVDYALPARHTVGAAASLKFTEQTWTDLEQRTDQLSNEDSSMRRLGWYHSHPNIDIFLSRWDLDVCTNFTRKTSLALVADPVRHLGGFFARRGEDFDPQTPFDFWMLADVDYPKTRPWNNLTASDEEWAGPFSEEMVRPRRIDLREPEEEGREQFASTEKQEKDSSPTMSETADPVRLANHPSANPLALILLGALFAAVSTITIFESRNNYNRLQADLREQRQMIELLKSRVDDVASPIEKVPAEAIDDSNAAQPEGVDSAGDSQQQNQIREFRPAASARPQPPDGGSRSGHADRKDSSNSAVIEPANPPAPPAQNQNANATQNQNARVIQNQNAHATQNQNAHATDKPTQDDKSTANKNQGRPNGPPMELN